MTGRGLEDGLLAALRAADVPGAARGFADDAAVLAWPLGLDLVATHDMMAEGVHFTAGCPPADVGWKLAAVNFSDLAAMGAKPVAVLLGAGVGARRDPVWALGLLAGVRQALDRFGGALVGGDTIRSGPASVLALSALGSVPQGGALGRAGARAGDELWVSGTIGDAGLGLEVALGRRAADPFLLGRYRRPTPRVALGLGLRGVASACMDVSDGLILDAARLAQASGVALEIRLGALPRSAQAAAAGVPPERLATLGDDYELLFTAPPHARSRVKEAATAARTPVTRIGDVREGAGLSLRGADGSEMPVPAGAGYVHA
ncbi:thiamine-phosphate kinase [Thermaurantiacus tibetensis]|uniref:thiamine-phosphate kinase n=1 Tax=Thermaurantiacus tibetensis TaxID=2759035 RepID=UPI002E295D4D|nr:thiamine-phosphate kinase [Thermaurantiacus tibetensis]